MFRSVFAKYILAFAALVLVSFSMLSVLISAMLSSYAEEQHTEDVKEAVRATANLTVFSMQQVSGKNDMDLESLSMNDRAALSSLLRSAVENREFMVLFIVDQNGRVIAASGTEVFSPEKHLDRSVLSEITREGAIFTGTLSGFLSEQTTVAALPIFSGDTLEGYAFAGLSKRAEELLFNSIHKSIVMASLWVMLAALVAAYFISDFMSTPLRNMIAASKKYAKGNFESRVPVVGHSEIAELSEAFNHMAESLADLEQMRNTFLSDTAHDLRTPMTTISGFIDGINSGAIPPEKQGYYLDIIQTEIHRLSGLVSQILDMSRFEAGRRTFTSSSFDICEMLRLVLISFEQKIEEKELEVSFETDADYISVFADKSAIYQVVYNLCDNAIKFSRNGGAFSLHIAKKGTKKIEITIYNEGCGIPAEDIPYIFTRFYKSDKSRGRDKNGFGIGLYIVKSIIDGHKERITVDSKEGEYCRFVFTLPLSEKQEEKRPMLPPEDGE